MRIIIVTLLWSDIIGGYNTPDTDRHSGRDRSVKVGHEIMMLKESIMDALTVSCLYVEKVEMRLLHNALLNHTVYHACFTVVKACC